MWSILLSFLGSAQYHAAMRLMAASQLINQAVGDALSGSLLVEAILQYKGWSFQNWCELYSDLPSRQLKVHTSGRDFLLVFTEDDDTTFFFCSFYHSTTCFSWKGL